MALSDADVQKQIKHMMAFIEQEANEKAEEIDAKAEEEFNIEKGRLVQQQRLKIMEFYERKEKQVELQRKIQSSNMLNQARLKALKVREEHVRAVLDEARKHMSDLSRNPAQYEKVLFSLIMQGLFQLLEDEVTIRVRQADKGVAESIFSRAQQEYKSQTAKEVRLVLDTEFLPVDTIGGIELCAQHYRIKIVNTVEARLELIAQQMIPEIRSALFGSNPNRKFTT